MLAWDDALDYYNSNTKEAQAIIAKNVGSKPDALTTSFEGIQLFDLQESQDFLENDYEGLWGDIAEIMLDQGQIEAVPDVNEYLNTELGAEALEAK